MKRSIIIALAMAAVAAVATSASAAGKPSASSGHRTSISSSSPVSPQVRQMIGDVRAIVKTYNRQNIESTVRSTVGSNYTVTSRDRPADSRLASRAHDRGAIDIAPRPGGSAATSRIQQDAQRISGRLGPHYQAIVEQKTRSGDLHTTYNNGVQRPKPHMEPSRATNTHIHIQPRSGFEVKPLPTPTPRPWVR